MTVVERERRIVAEPGAVWEVLADFGTIARWADFVDHSSMLHADGPAVGSARRIQAGRTVVLERITEVDPPRALAYEIEGLPDRVRSVVNRWTLRPAAPGATDVRVTTTVSIGPRPPQRLAERVLGRVLASRSDAMLAGLAAHLEDRRA